MTNDFLRVLDLVGVFVMGVDRIVMLVTGRSIRETLPFPLAKPR